MHSNSLSIRNVLIVYPLFLFNWNILSTELKSTVFNLCITYHTILKLTPVNQKWYSINKHDVRCNCQLSNPFLKTVWYLYVFCLEALGLLAYCFPFEGENISAANGVRVENALNGDREIIYGTYHMLEAFIWRVAKNCQCVPILPDPWQIYGGEYLLSFFHRVDKYKIKVF